MLKKIEVFLQVPSSQKRQSNQTIEFSWGLYCLVAFFSFVIRNLCLGTKGGSRHSDKGGARSLKKICFRPAGPQFPEIC